ncbi:YciE/YciF ferroxidase family protein [Frigidibacter sp. MR17.24]|uniref:YciE/YciF ferroxidase family protein n=1 Tax=Frigidibacter sp. MR17.24 TaxID=3127345 RepID=UPI003012DE48
MALFSKDIRSMDQLYLHMLQDIYYAEQQIEKALPKMIEKAGDQSLRDGFTAHLGETREHISRLERVFGLIGHPPKGTDCPAIDGILKEANEIAGDIEGQEVLDAALAAAAQAVEHYEITRYGTLIAWSKELDHGECAEILELTLAEEHGADDWLTALAQERLNAAAA